MDDLESTVMEIIVNAGQTRSLCFEALQAARDGDFAWRRRVCRMRIAIAARRIGYRPN